MEEEIKKAKRKKIFKIIYITVTLLIIIGIVFFDPNLRDGLQQALSLKVGWLVGALAMVLVYWITDALTTWHITSYIHKPVNIFALLKVSIIGYYYGALTPFATGGQPMQIMYMKRSNIPVGTSTCILAIRHIAYEAALCLLCLVAIVTEGAKFYAVSPEAFWLTVVGFFVNLALLVFVLLAVINKAMVERFVNWVFRVLTKMHIIRHPEKHLATVNKSIDDFSTASKYIGKQKLKILFSCFLSLLNHIALFSISFFIYRALGLEGETLVHLISLQAFLYLAVAYFPTPGAAGGSEGGFYLFFNTVFKPVPWTLPMLIWRFLTYYLVVIVGAGLIVVDEIADSRQNKKSLLPQDSEPNGIAPDDSGNHNSDDK